MAMKYVEYLQRWLGQSQRPELRDLLASPKLSLEARRDLLQNLIVSNRQYVHLHGFVHERALDALDNEQFEAVMRMASFDVSHLPETLTAYRGGTASPERLAQGRSWTLDRDVA